MGDESGASGQESTSQNEAETATWSIDVPTDTEETLEPDPERLFDSSDLGVDSQSYCVLDEEGRVVAGRKEWKTYAPASITKVLTALVVLDYADLLDTVTIQQSSLEENMEPMSSGVRPSFKPNEKVTVLDLLYALILASTNAAGNILADHVSGSTAGFAELMNQKCAQLGLTHSHFVNAHGLDAEGHYSCAYDMAVILKAAISNPIICNIMSTLSYTIPATEYTDARGVLMNHRMLGNDLVVPGVFAGKPGWTVNAQGTLLTAVERDGVRLYVCTMHSDDECHYTDTENLIEYCYAKLAGGYPYLKPVTHNITVRNADEKGVDIFFTIDNPAKSAQIVYWDLIQGTAAAVFGEEAPAKTYMGVHLSLPKEGPYAVQIFTTDQSGERYLKMFYVLYTGHMNDEGIVKWNGNEYIIDEFGMLQVGSVEVPQGIYCTNADGTICHGFTGRFYAGEDGQLVTGWITADGVTCYAQGDGRIATGRMMIDGVEYTFSETGVLLQ